MYAKVELNRNNYKIEDRNLSYFIFLFFIWVISPFASIFAALFIVLAIRINPSSIKLVFSFISISFALIAFTQKSLYWDGTDIERYYYGLTPILNTDYQSLPLFLSTEILNYSFTLVNIIIVALTRNVQSISIFWTYVIYYLFFLSIYNYIGLYHRHSLGSNKLMFATIVFSIFGSILFVQITETIKSAVAITLFFYTFTRYLKGCSKRRIILLLFIGTGIHAQTLMLLPIFLYRRVRFHTLLVVTVVVIVLCTQINLMDIGLRIIPSTGWSELLIERASGYASDVGQQSSKRYMFIGLLCFVVCVLLYSKGCFNNKNRIGNVVLIYTIIMFLNFQNSNAFIRFANFISFIATIEFVELYCNKKVHQLAGVLMVTFMILNLQMTLGRTISGGYCSSYMDNSIVKLILSNPLDYLMYKAYIV